MERIQLAINKAREARQLVQPKTQTAANETPDQAPRSDQSREDAWNGLTPFKPDTKHMSKSRIAAYHTGADAIPFDVMRTKLLYQMRANTWRRVAITSPGMACGKTMVSLNLAFSLARQSDIKVMVIELDMRRPSMARVLGLKNKHLFAKVLEGNAEPQDHIIRYGSNLAFATNHSPAQNPAELLQGKDGAAVLDAIEARYQPDVMIFDMPPMLVSDDTMAFLDQVDCGLLIGAAESTSIEEIENCEKEMASRTNVMGVVLNKCRYLDKPENYGY
ncbi:MAG: CpsD/CapB family tyrosine-protein kinase [Sulfitobacter sp.]